MELTKEAESQTEIRGRRNKDRCFLISYRWAWDVWRAGGSGKNQVGKAWDACHASFVFWSNRKALHVYACNFHSLGLLPHVMSSIFTFTHASPLPCFNPSPIIKPNCVFIRLFILFFFFISPSFYLGQELQILTMNFTMWCICF